MFSNSYNKKIQSEVLDLNKRFINHQKRVGRAMVNDATYMVGGNSDPWSFTGPGTKEGAGILSGILSDIGLGGKPKRGGQCLCSPGEKGDCCLGSGITGGKRKAGRPRKGKGVTGGAETGGASTGGKRKPGRPRKGKGVTGGAETGGAETGGKRKPGRPRKAMGKKGKGILSGLLSKIGLGEGDLVEAETGGKKRKAGRPRKGGMENMEGGNWFDDMTSGISQGMNAVLGPIASVAPLLALGKPKKGRKGKGVTGGAETGGKRKGKGVTGGASNWISHVKKWAKDHKMKYPDALKDPKCKMAYRK